MIKLEKNKMPVWALTDGNFSLPGKELSTGKRQIWVVWALVGLQYAAHKNTLSPKVVIVLVYYYYLYNICLLFTWWLGFFYLAISGSQLICILYLRLEITPQSYIFTFVFLFSEEFFQSNFLPMVNSEDIPVEWPLWLTSEKGFPTLR